MFSKCTYSNCQNKKIVVCSLLLASEKTKSKNKMSSNRYFVLKEILIYALIITNVTGVPLSPCPRNFHYEYDGEHWIGVARIYPRIYNSFRTNRIRTIIILLVNGQLMPGRVGSIDFYQSLVDTYREVSMKRPVVYRVNFPVQTAIPTLVEILVNNVLVCSNGMQQQQQAMYGYSSRIQLQHTFYLPSANANAKPEYFEAINEQTLPQPQLMFQPEVVSPLSPETISNNDSLEEQNLSTDDAVTCGRIDEKFKLTHLIMGGEKIARGTWPWLVAIFLKEVGGVSFLCTGNLVAHRIVLTAAHCFKMYSKENERKPNEILLAFGRYDLRDWTETMVQLSDADSINIHPDYADAGDDTNDADIAVIVTTKSISYNSFVRPICLWPSSSMAQNIEEIVGRTGTLIGWGQPRLTIGPNILRKVQMPIVSKSNCFDRSILTPETRAFCAGSRDGNGPCNGDSGSGLALWQNGAWFLRGIVSAAIGDPILNRCELNTFVIFTDITKFRQWINTYIVFAVK